MRLRKRKDSKYLVRNFAVVSGKPGAIRHACSMQQPAKPRGLPPDSCESVVKMVLRELTGLQFGFVDPCGTEKRVVFWHRFFTRGRSPIVVVHASESNADPKYAITHALRTLVDDFGLRVVVEGWLNSIDLCRQKLMTKEMVWRMAQLQDLFHYVQEVGLDHVVFAVLGGIPVK